MNKKLFVLALITAPAISLSGVGPLYIFDKLDLLNSFLLFLGLTVHVFLFWAINIYLVNKCSLWRPYKMYLLSFILVFLTHIPKIFIHPSAPFIDIVDRYFIYPAISTFSFNLIIWILINSIVLSEKKRLAEFQVELLTIKNLESQKQVLMQQLQPHFLFNSLSVLKSLIKVDVDEAEMYTIKLSEFLRYSVEARKQELVTLDKELKFANDYIELQKMRFDKAFHYDLNIPDSVLQFKIPVFSIQTLVENIFKHNHFTEKNPIRFKISYKDESLVIWNEKMPIKFAERTATGLQNLNRRYELITGKGIEISNEEHQFLVKIALIKP